MSRNGSGTYSLPAGNPVVTGTTISSTWANSTLTDIANTLTGSLASDGQTTATGNLNMGSNKIINVVDPSAQQDAATKYYTDTAIATSAAAVTALITPTNVSDKVNTSTGYFQVPQGSDAQRPASPANGIVRFNSTSGIYEGYINGDWVKFTTVSQSVYNLTFLTVAGGGGAYAGGGGAGGYLAPGTVITATSGNAYTIVVGAGGSTNTAGSNSSAFGATAYGGGNGGGFGAGVGGGSGGGGVTAGGAGTSGQGQAGSYGFYNGNPTNCTGGGGGGAFAAGSNGNSLGDGGAGGQGSASSISGFSVTYAGGGGGGGAASNGAGGTGGGGSGGNGVANTGGGGGGTFAAGSPGGGNGGSGVVVLTYVGSQRGTGGTYTSVGGYSIHTFNSSGTYTG